MGVSRVNFPIVFDVETISSKWSNARFLPFINCFTATVKYSTLEPPIVISTESKISRLRYVILHHQYFEIKLNRTTRSQMLSELFSGSCHIISCEIFICKPP